MNVFKEFARQEEADDSQWSTVKELIRLVQEDKAVSQFIELLYNMKHTNIKKNKQKTYAV